MKRLFLIGAVILGGCVSHSTVLVNSKGEEQYCEATGYGLVGMQISSYRYTSCVNEAGKKGFKPKEQN